MARRSRAPEGLTAARVAELVGGELTGDPDTRVTGVGEPEEATPEQVAFVADPRRAGAVEVSQAGILLLPADVDAPGARAVVRVGNPYLAFARVLEALYPMERRPAGAHPSAVVADDAELAEGVSVGANAVVEAGCRIGAGTEVGPGCVLGAGVQVGEDCLLHANVTLYDGVRLGDRVILHGGVVLGADGFGYAMDGRSRVKVPQVGTVVVEDDVEIGANACVDRGTFRATRIGRGSKIDNLVQIGHNCAVGSDCALSGLTGLAGSTVLEDGVVAGGNVGTAGHQRIGAGSMLAAKSGIHGDLSPGSVVGGAPHMEIGLWRRVMVALPRLPDLVRRVRRIERDLQRLEKE